MSDYKESKRKYKELRKEEKRQRKHDRKMNKYENKIDKIESKLNRNKAKDVEVERPEKHYETNREVKYDSKYEKSETPSDAPEGYSSFFDTTDPSFSFDSSEIFGNVSRPDGMTTDSESFRKN